MKAPWSPNTPLSFLSESTPLSNTRDRTNQLPNTPCRVQTPSSHRSSTSSAAPMSLSTRGSPDTPFFTVSGELTKNVSFVRKYKPLAELEEELFILCRDYEELFYSREVTLACVTTMFPLMQVTKRGSTTGRLEVEVEDVILQHPWELSDYQWVERVINFLNLLCMKWELVEPSLYSYRNTPLPRDPVLLHQYKLRQVWVFTMETIWFACAADKKPLRNRLPRETIELACKFHTETVGLIRFIASLNFEVNYQLYSSISANFCLPNAEEQLYLAHKLPFPVQSPHLSTMGKRIDEDLDEVAIAVGRSTLANGVRQITANKQLSQKAREMRQLKAKEVSFRLLELPSALLTCLETDLFRDNMRLKRKLQTYEKLYRVLDCQITLCCTASQPIPHKEPHKGIENQCEV